MTRTMTLVALLSLAIFARNRAWAQETPVAPAAPVAPATTDAAATAAPAVAASAVAVPAAAASPAEDPNSEQLDKLRSIYESATKIFGDEHTVISPSFFYATDIDGRLSTTEKHQAGLSGVLLLPLVGFGGGHGADWWPVIVSSDETDIYQTFLDKLSQYQQAQQNLPAVVSNVKTIANTKWNIQTLKVAEQLFCQENLDPDLPADAQAAIKSLCDGTLPTTVVNNVPSPEQQTVINIVAKPASADALVPKRHNLLLGPSLGIPLTKNPTEIFQLGASAEVGGKSFRIMASGGLVGRYSGGTYKDIFAAGWFVGIALSGEMGDELFHYFNGGSNLMTQLANIGKSSSQ